MAKEKVPLIFKAFDEFTEVVDEYRTLVGQNLKKIDGQGIAELNTQFHEIFQGEGLFLL